MSFLPIEEDNIQYFSTSFIPAVERSQHLDLCYRKVTEIIIQVLTGEKNKIIIFRILLLGV